MRKRNILFACHVILGMSTLTLSAQTETNTSFRNTMNSIFGNLEKHRVPHGILLDYGMELENLENFSGASLVDSNFVDIDVFWRIYTTLVTSKFQSTVPGFLLVDTLSNRSYRYRAPGQIILSGLLFNYSRFKSDAYPNFVTVTNNVIFDKYVSGVWQNPYESNQVFAIAPAISNYKNLSFTVLLRSDLWMTNNAANITGFSVDFADGLGFRTLTLGTPLSVSYSSEGIKEWKFRVNLTGGIVRNAHCQIQ
ncbi:MAG: hypothetical protein EOO01_36215, partial [Chitinophagaceae bacterium]